MNPSDIQTIELLPAGPARQLFVLLPPAHRQALDMLPLGALLAESFEQAAVVMVEPLPQESSGMTWQLASLLGFVRYQQERFKILQTDTALAGFSDGASLALALSQCQDGLVGRVLAFSARYPHCNAEKTLGEESVAPVFTHAPVLTTLHLLHGQLDVTAPVSGAQQAYADLMEIGGDVTLDVASRLGHELHPALMAQAVKRLQTCVPLRVWRAAS